MKKHGFFISLWPIIKRFFKCNPWSKGGIDKVN
ncbi:UNVERIFIED_CONTAM: hypothetical protein GTU68_013600 [Idotea baltica]|nr:hypothetical protein [Idotea baltica]